MDRKIRIRPADIDVPEHKPFKHDLLGRQKPAEALTELVDSIAGPCVLAVDAAWGAGKTTFLKMWSQSLRNCGFPVVSFNAWETDHAGDPFLALVSEITGGLREYKQGSFSVKVKDTKEAAKKVLLRAMPGLVRVATAGVLDIQPLIEKEAGQLLSSLAETRFSKYREAQDSIGEFRTKLGAMARALVESSGQRRLIVMIDELDRCRPSYAVELLEVAKHLFEVDHIIFVLAINRTQLAHSIRALYGHRFDSDGYLRRFVDVDYVLPEPDRNQLIRTLLDDIDIPERACEILQAFFGVPSLSVRQIGQAIHRLRVVVASAPNKDDQLICAAVAALVLRTIDADMYWKLVRGGATDKKVVDTTFERAGITTPENEDAERIHACALFEATIAMGWNEIKNGDAPRRRNEQIDTPLLSDYRQLLERARSDGDRNLDVQYAEYVISFTSEYKKDVGYPFGRPVRFVEAVRRMELIASFGETE